MIKQVADKERLLQRSELLRRRQFKAGFDGMDAQAAHLWLEINGARLIKDLLSGSYNPMPAIGFRVAKMNGSYRRLARLTALDTIIEGVVLDVVGPGCEELFSDYSYAYRPGRGVAAALRRYCDYAARYPYAAKADPTACFDNFDYEVLERAVRAFINDKKVVRLLMDFARMPVIVDGQLHQPEKGVLQGAPLSVLFCNLYFHELDKRLEQSGVPFIRYGDDIVLFGKSLPVIQAAHQFVEEFLREHLFLEVNRQKSRIDAATAIIYLGNRFEYNKHGVIALAAHTPAAVSYHNWHASVPLNNRRRVDILSDGILRQKDYSLLFESECEDTGIPVAATDVINIYSNVVFDSGFLKKAQQHGIVVNVFDSTNKLLGTFVPNGRLKAPRVIHEQLTTYYDPARRLALAKGFVLASIHNLRLNIRYYNKQRSLDRYETVLSKIYSLERKIKEADDYDGLLMLEAQVRQLYFSCFDDFIQGSGFLFEKRTRRPPMNEVNALLSFGNTVLYNLIATEIYKSSLDIRVGFLHATNRRKESLNLDISEIFRPLVVDRTIFALINRKSVQKKHFTKEENDAFYLTEEGKRLFLRAFYEKLDTVVTVGERKMSYSEIIKDELRRLTRHFKTGEPYKQFRQVR